MTASSIFRLLILSAIWGGSFIFMRIAVPALGPVMLMELRVLFAALFLAGVAHFLKSSLAAGTHWKHYLILGFFNSALPFLLFGYAALTLPASLMAILNATAPLWSTLIGIFWLRQRLSRKPLARPPSSLPRPRCRARTSCSPSSSWAWCAAASPTCSTSA